MAFSRSRDPRTGSPAQSVWASLQDVGHGRRLSPSCFTTSTGLFYVKMRSGDAETAAFYVSMNSVHHCLCTGAPTVNATSVQDVADRGEGTVGELSQLPQGPAGRVLLDDERLDPGLHPRVRSRAGGARELGQRP